MRWALAHTIEFASLEELYLDPLNPRLGRAKSGASVTQSQVLEQMRGWSLLGIEVSDAGMENRFSVLFLSLREAGVQDFLGVNIRAEPEDARTPVPTENFDELSEFGRWLFGTEDRGPIFTDSREVGNFARILSSAEAVEYLRSSPNFSFELALQKAGIEDEEIEIPGRRLHRG